MKVPDVNYLIRERDFYVKNKNWDMVDLIDSFIELSQNFTDVNQIVNMQN